MRIVLKLILWLVILVVGLTASLAAYLMFFFNPNDYRTQIEERALSDAGVELKINGDIGWSFYPWLGLELKQLSVNYPGQPQLAELASAGAALNIPALLGGTVQLDSIRVDGLVLNLVRDAEGRENWVTAKGAQQESESGKGESERGQGDGELRLAIDQISLSNAKISFEDQIWARKVELNSLNLTASSVSVDKPFPLNFQGALKQTDAGEVTTQAQMELSSEINLNALQGVFELRNLVSKVSLQQAGLEKPLIVDLNSDIRLVQADQRLSIDNLKLALAGLSITGKLALTNFESQNLEGNLDIAEFNPRTLASSFGAELPELGEGALRKVAAKFALGGDAKSLQLNNLDLILDDTQISGALAVNAESGVIVANLNVDQINLDRYMAPSAAVDSQAEEAPEETGWSKEPLFDAEPLKAINAELKLQIGKALYQGNAIEQIALDLSAKAGDIRMKKLAAMAFGGKADVSGAIDARANPVKLAIKPNFSGIKVEQLMALAMEETPVKASANLTAALTTSGNSLHAIINGLNGELNLTAEEGVIEGIDMAQELCQKIENLTSLGIDPDQVDRTTPIADLKSAHSIKNGVVTNPSTTAGLDAALLDAKGTIDLPNQAFDYNLGLALTDDLFKQSCGINPALKGVRIPVNCKGMFDTDPAKLCALDTSFVSEVIKKAIGAKAQAEIEKRKAELEQQAKEKLQESLQDKVGDKLKEDAGSLLKGLFGN